MPVSAHYGKVVMNNTKMLGKNVMKTITANVSILVKNTNPLVHQEKKVCLTEQQKKPIQFAEKNMNRLGINAMQTITVNVSI